MKTKDIFLFIVIFLTLIPVGLFAQDPGYPEPAESTDQIILTGKNTGSKIILRWAPSNSAVWHLSNFHGYMVERLAFRDTSDLRRASYELLTPDTLKPWPLEEWATIVNDEKEDKYAAIAAHALYGKRNKSDLDNEDSNIFEKAREFNNLYAIAMLGAEYSANAAIASALRYEDKDIDPVMTYFYRVYSNANDPDLPIDTAYLVIKGNEINEPVPVSLERIDEDERSVTLVWDRLLENAYSSWIVERSEDGGNTFYRLNENPYIDSADDSLDIGTDYIRYTDTLSANYKPYYYRIRGINTFAEISDPSPAIMAMGRDRTPPPVPTNIEVHEIQPGQMQVSWKLEDPSNDLEGFLISRTEEINGPEIALTTSLIDPSKREYIDTSYHPLRNNWYYVYAVDTALNASVGLPSYGSIVDSIAPATPTGFAGTIDSNGVVSLNWDLGPERDLYGYMVYFANARDHIFINATNKAVKDTFYRDTIPLNVLTEKIYYKLIALDATRNQSDFSEVLELKKPDINPPVAPVFTAYEVKENGIELEWVNSSSQDVIEHTLFRNELGSNNWNPVLKYPYSENRLSFTDTNTAPGKTYRYKIQALDDDGLWSEDPDSIMIKAIDFSEVRKVDELAGEYQTDSKSILLSWNYPEGTDAIFLLFRATNNGPFTLHKELTSDVRKFADNQVITGNSYEYTIKVQLPSGRESEFNTIRKIDLSSIKNN